MVSEKQINAAMKILCHYYETYPEGHYMTISGMHMAGIKNSDTVVDVLEAKEFVTIRKEYKEANRSEYPVRLTSKGKTYFTDKQHENMISRKQFIHDGVVAVIGAVAGSFITLFLAQRSEGSSTSSS